MSNIDTSLKVVKFSKRENWFIWKELFMALMERKDREVFDCLDLSKEFKLTKIENGVEVPDEENRVINNKAYSELLMSMDVSTPE